MHMSWISQTTESTNSPFCRLGIFQNFSLPFLAARMICYSYFFSENIRSDETE